MTSVTSYFQAMACNNAWANERLITVCEQLSDADFTSHRIGFFPSLMLTLNHILVVDWFYVDGLEGGTLGPDAWSDPAPCQTARILRAAQQTVDQRLIDFSDALTQARLEQAVHLNRGTRVQVERVDRVLLHLFQHQVHHRGQAHAMLSATDVQPPQLDEFFVEEDAPLRKTEMQRLGWGEAELWHDFAGSTPAAKKPA
jgi:uncharacterized damage-inducible protein DinB